MSAPVNLQMALDYLAKGDWEEAHKIVQSDESTMANWIHGIVHVVEGDMDNARYWYGQAGRAFSADVVNEIAAARDKLLPA